MTWKQYTGTDPGAVQQPQTPDTQQPQTSDTQRPPTAATPVRQPWRQMERI